MVKQLTEHSQNTHSSRAQGSAMWSQEQSNPKAGILYLAGELSSAGWKGFLGASTLGERK